MNCPTCKPVTYHGRHVGVDLCPLHAAAPALLQALNNSARLAHKNTRGHSSWLSFRECEQATCVAAREAIRKAESPDEVH